MSYTIHQEHTPPSEEECEPSALEYARANGLSIDYQNGNEQAELEALLRLVDDNIFNDAHLQQFRLGNGPKLEERISFPKHAATLLSSATVQASREEVDSKIASLLQEKTPRLRKLELPLLRSDHNADFRLFASRKGFDVTLENVDLPLEPIDDERNEGLVWSARYWNMGPAIVKRLKAEKLVVSRSMMTYLADVRKIEWTEEDATSLWESEQKFKRNNALKPVTPPLSPAFKALPQPYEPDPSDPAFQVPLCSDPISPTKQELETLEKEIFDQDVPTPLRQMKAALLADGVPLDAVDESLPLKLGDIYPPLASPEKMPPSPGTKRVKREDLKVEELLTPDKSEITMPKAVRFSDVIEEMQLDPYSSSIGTPSNDIAKIMEVFGDALNRANQLSEQEELSVADATARVDVPIMDFSHADPPWKKFEGVKDEAGILALQLSLMRTSIGQKPIKPVSFNSRDIKLKWTPFPPNFAKVAVEEHFKDDDHNLERILAETISGDMLDSSGLTWKQPNPMILRDDEEDEEEIDYGVFRKDTPADLTSLVKKRKIELQVREELAQKNNGQIAKQVPGVNRSKTYSVPRDLEGQVIAKPSMLLGDMFSTGNALNNLLELRGAKRAKLTDSTYFWRPADTSNNVALPVVETIMPQPVVEAATLPARIVPLTTTPVSVITSSTLLRNRSLVKQLEQFLPGLNIVERDFTAHNTTTWQPGSVTRSPIKSPLDSEADLIISPTTGVVLTTLQKIKQRPLPGQSRKPAIRERIETVANRYEKLIVLVSEGRPDETTIGLDENDCLAYSDFVGFTTGFVTQIVVKFVAGGERALSNWIAKTVVQERLEDDSNLLVEETHWELFLRRAGFNAFAAQAILVELKAPDGVDPGSPSKAGHFGLTAFVEMGQGQRIDRFGPICGRLLMERVSAVVDASWK